MLLSALQSRRSDADHRGKGSLEEDTRRYIRDNPRRKDENLNICNSDNLAVKFCHYQAIDRVVRIHFIFDHCYQ